MSQKKIRAALVGFGYWGTNLLRNMTLNPHFEVVGMVENSAAARAKCSAIHPYTKTFESLDACLKDARPEAVVIATPPESHCALALQALAAGAHVLIEKPMAVTTGECQQIMRAAQQAKRLVMVDHTFLFHPPVSFLAKEIHGGKYGDLLYYDSVRVNLGGFQRINVLWDLAPHDIAILDHFLQGRMPSRVSALGVKHFGAPVETLCYVNMMYDHDFMAHLHLNWAAPVKGRQITLGATAKMVVYDDNTPVEKVRVYDKGVNVELRTETDLQINYRVGEMVAPVIPQREALAEMLVEFAVAVRENRRPLSDGEQGLRVVQVLEALSMSLREGGRPVDLSIHHEIQVQPKRVA